jgi:hypothetical protein
MRSSNLMSNVQRDFTEAVAAGAKGTPFTVMLAAGDQVKFGDAQSYQAMRAVVETTLKQLKHVDTLVPPEGVIPPSPMPLSTEQDTETESVASTSSTTTADNTGATRGL